MTRLKPILAATLLLLSAASAALPSASAHACVVDDGSDDPTCTCPAPSGHFHAYVVQWRFCGTIGDELLPGLP